MLLQSFVVLPVWAGLTLTAHARQTLLSDGLAHPYDSIKNFAKNLVHPAIIPEVVSPKTIYQTLADSSQFTRLHKAIDFSGDDVVGLLDDEDASLTFFAVPDWALERHGCPHKPHHFAPESKRNEIYDFTDLSQISNAIEDFERSPHTVDRDERKKFLKKLIRAILLYHILPDEFDAAELKRNTTFATELKLTDGSLDGKPLRLSARHGFGGLSINLFSKVVSSDLKATNGIIHTLNHPLFPPPTIFEGLFAFPDTFSYLTSALQRTGLTNELDLHKDGKLIHGATTTTFFAPSNRAFQELPFRLRLFLFSPFGEKVLKKLLEYHVVPGYVLHSDYVHHEHKESATPAASGIEIPDLQQWVEEVIRTRGIENYKDIMRGPSTLWDHSKHKKSRHHRRGDRHDDHSDKSIFSFFKSRPSPPQIDPVFSHNYTLETLLPDHLLHVHVAQYHIKVDLPGHHNLDFYKTRVLVNGKPVVLPDNVSRNGAAHIIHHLIDPRQHHHFVGASVGAEGWEDWEDWLVQWAEQN